jgi:histidinol-phosphate aminotransferase
VVADGAAQLLGAAAQALLEPLDELVTPWPSYGLYPGHRPPGRGRAVPSRASGAGGAARGQRPHAPRRPVQSQRPTGELVASTRCARCSRRCPSASSCSSTRRCATSSTPSSATPRSRWSRSSRACSSSDLLQGVGPAGLRVATRSAARRRAAARAARAGARLNELAQAGALEALRHAAAWSPAARHGGRRARAR